MVLGNVQFLVLGVGQKALHMVCALFSSFRQCSCPCNDFRQMFNITITSWPDRNQFLHKDLCPTIEQWVHQQLSLVIIKIITIRIKLINHQWVSEMAIMVLGQFSGVVRSENSKLKIKCLGLMMPLSNWRHLNYHHLWIHRPYASYMLFYFPC